MYHTCRMSSMYDSPRLHDPSCTLSKSHGLSPASTNNKWDTSDSIHKIQSVATECDDIQTTILMNWVECKKQKNYRILVVKCHIIYAFYFLKITSKWSSWHKIHSCDCDQKLIILCSRHSSVSLILSLYVLYKNVMIFRTQL